MASIFGYHECFGPFAVVTDLVEDINTRNIHAKDGKSEWMRWNSWFTSVRLPVPFNYIDQIVRGTIWFPDRNVGVIDSELAENSFDLILVDVG